jgi:hypothetical protein
MSKVELVIFVALTCMLLLAAAGSQAADTPFEATVRVDFGEDLGQNFGSLFEVRDADDQPLLGAGFSNTYNTYNRMDRHKLQFHARLPGAVTPTFETLPKPTEWSGIYIFDFDGRVCGWSHDQGAYVLKYWDEAERSWKKLTGSTGLMRLGDGLLVCGSGGATYQGREILAKPAEGSYSGFYYAKGNLCFYHTKSGANGFTRICLCPWTPKSKGPLDLAKMQTVDARYVGETTWAWGYLGRHLITVSNNGGVYVFNGESWRILREADNRVSYQVYSVITYYDKLLMAQYPSGNLFEYDGYELKQLTGQPPVMPGVADAVREAQTTAVYRGDLYVGVWPWSELWRSDGGLGKWAFVRRIFTRPEITDSYGHPFEKDVAEYNQAHSGNIVSNGWGQRVTGLVPQGDALYLSTSSKGPEERETRLAALTDEVFAEYGQVLRMKLPGNLAVTVQPTTGSTELRFALEPGRMAVYQDGKLLGAADLDPKLADALQPASITWGRGLFGRLEGRIVSRSVRPALGAPPRPKQ